MKQFVKIMKALSDPNRVKILKLLQQRTMCVCEIHFVLAISQPAVSNHLKILSEAGLVKSSKEGLWVNYSLFEGEGNTYCASMLDNFRRWFNDDPEMEAMLLKAASLKREEICRK
jgi:ArsR family transcriptional regulator